jgi:aspartate aminotransferase
MKLSKLTNNLVGQPMFQLKKKIREYELLDGKEILHFEIGDSPLAPSKEVIATTIMSLVGGETHYTASGGMIELKEEIGKFIIDYYGFMPSMEQILVMPANAVIDFVVRSVCDEGDEVIVSNPCFPTYTSVLAYKNIKTVYVNVDFENNFGLKAEEIEKAITKHTKLIIINSPSNPTGGFIEEEDLIKINQLCRANGIYLLCDEVYSEIIYDDSVRWSPCMSDKCKNHTILLKSFSKTFNMTGYRLGYVIANEELIEKMMLMFQTIFSCMPVFTQRAGIAALKTIHSGEQYFKLKELKECRDLIVDGLNSIKGISCKKPEGAFYVFPSIKGTQCNSNEFANLLLDSCRIAVLPGNCFGSNGEGFIRLCFATEKRIILEAIQRMKELLC